MPNCRKCGRLIDTLENQVGREYCPHCRLSSAGDLDNDWVDVARVANLAEAGFLSDELAGQDIEARVFQSDDFSHVEGGWRTTYLLRVPAAAAQRAAAEIRAHITDATEEGAGEEQYDCAAETDPVDPHYWRPVAVIVLAGMASFALGRQSVVPPVDSPPPRDSLAAAVNTIGRPLVTEVVPGEPQHRLWYHHPTRSWILETDRNADGLFESQRRFQSSFPKR